jgi:AbrB family looped-hinge helix DNA binding protein
MTTATLTSKGQVTIPKQVREFLHLHTGDRIEFVLQKNSEAMMKPVTKSVDDVFGRLHDVNQKALSVDEMNAAIAQRMRGSKK